MWKEHVQRPRNGSDVIDHSRVSHQPRVPRGKQRKSDRRQSRVARDKHIVVNERINKCIIKYLNECMWEATRCNENITTLVRHIFLRLSFLKRKMGILKLHIKELRIERGYVSRSEPITKSKRQQQQKPSMRNDQEQQSQQSWQSFCWQR